MVWEASLLGPCVQISENKSIKTFVNSDLPGPPREGLAWKSVEKLLKECKDNLESLTLMGIRYSQDLMMLFCGRQSISITSDAHEG